MNSIATYIVSFLVVTTTPRPDCSNHKQALLPWRREHCRYRFPRGGLLWLGGARGMQHALWWVTFIKFMASFFTVFWIWIRSDPHHFGGRIPGACQFGYVSRTNLCQPNVKLNYAFPRIRIWLGIEMKSKIFFDADPHQHWFYVSTILYSTSLHLPRLRFMGLNPGLLEHLQWQSDGLNTRLDLIPVFWFSMLPIFLEHRYVKSVPDFVMKGSKVIFNTNIVLKPKIA